MSSQLSPCSNVTSMCLIFPATVCDNMCKVLSTRELTQTLVPRVFIGVSHTSVQCLHNWPQLLGLQSPRAKSMNHTVGLHYLITPVPVWPKASGPNPENRSFWGIEQPRPAELTFPAHVPTVKTLEGFCHVIAFLAPHPSKNGILCTFHAGSL